MREQAKFADISAGFELSHVFDSARAQGREFMTRKIGVSWLGVMPCVFDWLKRRPKGIRMFEQPSSHCFCSFHNNGKAMENS
jgi:hypothetical protein